MKNNKKNTDETTKLTNKNKLFMLIKTNNILMNMFT